MSTAEAQARYPLTRGVNPWLVTRSVMLPTFMELLDTAIASLGAALHRRQTHTLLFPILLTGSSLSFVFVPLAIMSTSTLPREEMGNATGLFNMRRHIGGSIGIAWRPPLSFAARSAPD